MKKLKKKTKYKIAGAAAGTAVGLSARQLIAHRFQSMNSKLIKLIPSIIGAGTAGAHGGAKTAEYIYKRKHQRVRQLVRRVRDK